MPQMIANPVMTLASCDPVRKLSLLLNLLLGNLLDCYYLIQAGQVQLPTRSFPLRSFVHLLFVDRVYLIKHFP